jgi:hypothetical protein
MNPTIQDLIDQLTAALAAAQAIADGGTGGGDATVVQGQFDQYKTLVQAYADAPNDNDSAQLQAMKDYLASLPTPPNPRSTDAFRTKHSQPLR